MADETSSPAPWKPLVGAIVILIGAKIGISRWENSQLAFNAVAPDPAAHQSAQDVLLINAARAGNVASAQAALAAGASVNAFDSHGRTALSEALRVGAWEVADLCLTKPFSPKIVWAASNPRESQIGDAALFWAARQGRLENVRKLLELGARPNGQDTGLPSLGGENFYKESPVAAAVEGGSLPVVELLIKKGASTAGLFNEGVPLLWLPLKTRNLAMFKHLLQLEVPRVFVGKAVDPFSITPAIAKLDWTDGMNALLDLGLGLGSDKEIAAISDAKTRLRLKKALQAGRFTAGNGPEATRKLVGKFVQELYDEKSPPSVQKMKELPIDALRVTDHRGWTLLCYAIDANRIDLLRVMVASGASVNAPYNDAGTPLALAVSLNRPAAVEFLVANGANVEACPLGGMTPLGQAVALGYHPLAEWLLAHGARVNPPDGLQRREPPGWVDIGTRTQPDGRPHQSPLMIAARAGDAVMTKRLLAAGALTNAVDNYDQSVMLLALIGKNPEVIRLLEAKGESREAGLTQGSIVLSSSIQSDDLTYARLLLELGVPISSQTIDNIGGRPPAAALLEEFRAKSHDPRTAEAYFWDELRNRSSAELAAFLAQGGHANWEGVATPLQIAASYGRTDMIKILLDNGADPNRHGTRDDAPILIGAVGARRSEETSMEMIKLLLDGGADIDACSPRIADHENYYGEPDRGDNALRASLNLKKLKVMRLLLDSGASVSIPDRDGKLIDSYLEKNTQYDATTKAQLKGWIEAARKTPPPKNAKKKGV